MPIEQFLDRVETGMAMVMLFELNLDHFRQVVSNHTPWYKKWKSSYRRARKITHEYVSQSRKSMEQAHAWGTAARERGCKEVILSLRQWEFLNEWPLFPNLVNIAIHFPPLENPYR